MMVLVIQGPNRGNKGISFKDYSRMVQQNVTKFDVKHPWWTGRMRWSAPRGLMGGAQYRK